MNDFVAIDFETSYTKTRDIRSMGVVPYLAHPDTQIYRVSIESGSRDVVQVGPPEELDWTRINGRMWISHNAGFDSAVFAELKRRRPDIVDGIAPSEWNCSADLASYRQVPRALNEAAKVLLGARVDKSVRAGMRGVEFDSLSPLDTARLDEYALKDAVYCAVLWKYGAKYWPEQERKISRHTALMGQRGIGFDEETATVAIEKLERIAAETAAEVPWAVDSPVSSPLRLKAECERLGIPPPATTDSKSSIFDDWADAHADAAPFVAKVQKWRRANRLLKTLIAMQNRTIDGRIRYNLKYFGAHTGRWSGDAGLNMQNFPRSPFEGADARRCLIPGPGHRFIVADLAQIEARITLWLANDRVMLARLGAGEDLYETYARERLGYADSRPMREADPRGRQLAKALVLALGFGMGHARFVSTAKALTGLELTEGEARSRVLEFRDANPGIVKLWGNLDQILWEASQEKAKIARVVMPSGRILRYFNVCAAEERVGYQITATVEQGSANRHLWGGVLTENLVQATARDILAEAILKVEAMGLPVVLHVHDELIAEVTEEDAEDARVEISRVLATPPEWAEGLPLAAEVSVEERYG